MNFDNAAIASMLQTQGVPSPFGTPGFGPAFGPLPQLIGMQPGFSMGSGSFFGPQLYSPQYPNYGGTLGGLAGFGLQSAASGFGYSYFNRNSNLVDVFQGRGLESGLRAAMEAARPIDEERLARAIERAMYATRGPGAYTAASRATAESVLGPLSAIGMSSLVMPGGSAMDFARGVYMASQNVRDYTRTNFALGLPNREALSLISRVSDYMAPAGLLDPLRTRGLSQTDMGTLSSELTRMGLLDFRPPSDSSVTSMAKRMFGTDVQLSGPEMSNLRQTAQTVNVSKQLRDYADVVGTMREILGDKDAPIPTIIQQLQQLTGNTLQELSPQAANQLLVRMRELARVSNISVTMMSEIAKSGADMARQIGMRGDVGSLLAQSAASSAVVSQTTVNGPFAGRMTPDQEFNTRFQLGLRNATSPAMRMAAQAQMLLQSVDVSGLSPDQRAAYDQIKRGAQNVSWTPRSMNDLVGLFEKIGVGQNRSLAALNSNVGVEQFLAAHPEMITAVQRAGMQEPITELNRITNNIVNSIVKDKNDTLGQAIAASGTSPLQVSKLVAESYRYADTAEGRAAWLQGKGLKLSTEQLNSLLGSVDRSVPVNALMQRVGVKTPSEFMQLFSETRQKAIEQQQTNLAIAIEGQNILRDANVQTRGDVLERIVGSLGRGNRSVSAMLAGAGFASNADIQAMFSESATNRVVDIVEKLREAKDPDEIADLRSQLSVAISGIVETADRIPGLGDTERVQNLIGKITPEMIGDARTVMSVTANDDAKLASMRNIAGMAAQLTDSDIRSGTEPLGNAGKAVSARMSTMRDAAKRFNSLLQDYEDAPNAAIREELRQKLMSDEFRNVFGFVQGDYDSLRRGLNQRLRSGGSYTYEKAAKAFNAIEAKKKELAAASTPEERAQKLRELQDLVQQNTSVLYEEKNGIFTPRSEFGRDMAFAEMFAGKSTKEIMATIDQRTKMLSEQRNDVSAILLADPSNPEQVDALAKQMAGPPVESLNPDALKGGYDFSDEQLAAIREGTVPDRELNTPVGQAMRRAMHVKNVFGRVQSILASSRTAVTPGLVNALQVIMHDKDLFKDGRLDPEALKLMASINGGSVDQLSDVKSLFDKMADAGMDASSDTYKEILKGAAGSAIGAATKAEPGAANAGTFSIKFTDAATGADLGHAINIEVGNAAAAEDGRAGAAAVPVAINGID